MMKKGSFFPFSPTFLSEYVGVDLDSDDSEGQNNIDVNEEVLEDVRVHEQTDDARPFLVGTVVQDELYVVGIRESETCFLAGFAIVTSLTDNLLLDGYLAVLNERVSIDRPVWTPALKIWVNSGGNRAGTIVIPEDQRHRKKIRTAIKALQESSENNPLVSFFIVEKMASDREDIFSYMEDTSSCQITNTNNPADYPQYHQPLLSAIPTQAISVTTALFASERYMTLHRFDVSRYPKQWLTTVSEVLKPPRRCLRVMLAGAKGTGKSTCLKYIVNQSMFLVRKHPKRSIYILDLDLGQPELYTPGSLSLHKLTQPLLSSASYLHLQKPVASVFLGDITSKNEPGLYLAAVKRLFDQFLQLCQHHHHHHHHHQHKKDKSDTTPSVNESSTTSSVKQKGTQKNKDKANTTDTVVATSSSGSATHDIAAQDTNTHHLSHHGLDDLPHHPILLINTDGFVRHLGADILAGVIEVTQPTHILHLQPRPSPINNNNNNNNNNSMKAGQRQQQERHQAAVQVSQTLHDMLTQLIEPPLDPTNQCDTGVLKTELFALQSAIYQPMRHISAPELRHLRLVAYFLRHTTDTPQACQTLRNLLLCRGTPAGSTDPVLNRLWQEVSRQQRETQSLVSIKNAVLQDPRHVLPLRLLTHAPCVIVPLRHVLLQSVTQETQPLRPELWLACVNARLVGVSVLWETHDTHLDDTIRPVSHYEPLRLKLPPQHTDDDTSCNGVSITVGGVLPPLTQSTDLRCDSLGLGIVRCVDVTHRDPEDVTHRDCGALYLICPALCHYLSQPHNNVHRDKGHNHAASSSSETPSPSLLDVSRVKVILTLASPTLQLPPHLTGAGNTTSFHHIDQQPSKYSNRSSDNYSNSVSVAGWPGHSYVFCSDTMAGEGRTMNKPRPNLKRRQPPNNSNNNSNLKKKK